MSHKFVQYQVSGKPLYGCYHLVLWGVPLEQDFQVILLLSTKVDPPTWQFWDSGGVKLESLCNFSIVVCQWTVNCLLGLA